MSDIVERLKAVAAMDLRAGPILAHTLDTAAEGAAEIKRLRAVLKGHIEVATDLQMKLAAERERFAEVCDNIANGLGGLDGEIARMCAAAIRRG